MRKKIDFLNRIFDLLQCRIALLQHLRDEKLITDDTVQVILNEHHAQHAQRVATLLEELAKADKIQLLHYEWQVLPVEHLKLTLITNNNRREFEFNS